MQHPNEGTIHAWIDGELDAGESTALETHIESCERCREAVAEARGLVAGASRILASLDDVPGDVIPAWAPSAAAEAPDLRPITTARRRFTVGSQVVGGIGASLLAAGLVLMVIGTGDKVEISEVPNSAFEADRASAPVSSVAQAPPAAPQPAVTRERRDAQSLAKAEAISPPAPGSASTMGAVGGVAGVGTAATSPRGMPQGQIGADVPPVAVASKQTNDSIRAALAQSLLGARGLTSGDLGSTGRVAIGADTALSRAMVANQIADASAATARAGGAGAGAAAGGRAAGGGGGGRGGRGGGGGRGGAVPVPTIPGAPLPTSFAAGPVAPVLGCYELVRPAAAPPPTLALDAISATAATATVPNRFALAVDTVAGAVQAVIRIVDSTNRTGARITGLTWRMVGGVTATIVSTEAAAVSRPPLISLTPVPGGIDSVIASEGGRVVPARRTDCRP